MTRADIAAFVQDAKLDLDLWFEYVNSWNAHEPSLTGAVTGSE
jgi:hypothetical protein